MPAPEEYTPPPAPVVHEYPDSGAVPGGEAPPVPPEGATQVEYPQQPQPPDYYGQGYWTPFGWYPPPYPPPGYGYGPGYQLSPDQTVQIPVVPPVPPPGYPPVLPVPPEGASFFPLPAANEEAEFRELAREETPLWRVDFKWVFGLVTALFLLITLTLAGFYRVTGPGASRHVLAPLIERSTEVKESVRKNYQDIKKLARKAKNANIAIPDVGVDITIKSDVIKSLSADDLAERVIGEITRQAYSRGYSGDLPMKRAVGAGEERGKATSATYLALLNRKNHRSLILPLAVCGGITLAFAILFLIFCRRWGKLTGLGLAFIVGSLPGSLLIRIGSEFFWNVNTTGVYRGAMYQAFRSTGALMSAYYDIALALGALILLVGVIVGLVARRARERVPPFLDLKEPEEAVAGGPPIEAGLLPPQPAPDIQETEKEPTASGQ